MKVEFHILQNFPPSNLNRDDAGAPKDCDFGGYRRQRISSQCLKRSVRQDSNFQKQLADRIGIRTKKAPAQVVNKLVGLGYDKEDSKTLTELVFNNLYGIDEKGNTKYLIFVGNDELDRLVSLIDANAKEALDSETAPDKDEKNSDKLESACIAIAKKYKAEYPNSIQAIDIGLFGRMLANSPSENIDAGCQVAHAISVNRMKMEFDYYTAVDDISEEDSSGAGMIGTVGFASSCFYRYAVVDLDKLSQNLGGNEAAAREGLMAFAQAFINARPSGKQNTFAAHTPPAYIQIGARNSGQPVSLANAFENPAKPHGDLSLTDDAINKLCKYYSDLKRMYTFNGKSAFVSINKELSGIETLRNDEVEQVDNLDQLFKKLESFIETKIEVI